MQGETKELWKKLCEEASTEQDSERLVQLVQEINRLIEEKQLRLKNKEQSTARRSRPSELCNQDS
jgi:hypothetical protein